MASQSVHRATTFLSAMRSFNPTPSICRCFSTTQPISRELKSVALKNRAAKQAARLKKRRNPFYRLYNLKKMDQFSLCDAIRYLKAVEVGNKESNMKYEVHVKLKTGRSGPVIRQNTLQLPHPVKTGFSFAVICPVDSKAYKEAKEAGAALVGEEDIFDQLTTGKFDRIIAHPKSMDKIKKAGLPRILGPKGMMPNPKNGTVTPNPKELLQRTLGGALYRERFGVVRLCIGTLAFTPEMVRKNLSAFISRIKEDSQKLGDDTVKQINEVVLSSTNGPGLSLNGTFMSENSLPTSALSV